MSVPKIHALNFALKYAPPTLVMHYCKNGGPEEFAHQVQIFLKSSTTAATVANELIKEEPIYFGAEVVQREQLIRLIQKLIDNKGKKIGRLKLLSKAALLKAQGVARSSDEDLSGNKDKAGDFSLERNTDQECERSVILISSC
eukprot:TRINITY_DN4534_c0_g3_i2.p1 TRINITY_DN4534_c0_g3~~TRINITY_DN4534_c0_g3_i2.p1  ORF type:complete len:143 (-),score=34.15 TRINITY_DN4534_c0_g3_i2:290-718(-)